MNKMRTRFIPLLFALVLLFAMAPAVLADGTGKNINTCQINLSADTFVFTGAPQTPAVTVKDGASTLIQGTHYEVGYQFNVNAGQAQAIVTGIEANGYTGTATILFNIIRAEQPVVITNPVLPNPLLVKYNGTAQLVVTGAQGAITYTVLNPSLATVNPRVWLPVRRPVIQS